MVEIDFTCWKKQLPHQPSVRPLIRQKVPIIRVPCHISANTGVKEVQCNPKSADMKREIHFRNLKVGRVARSPRIIHSLSICDPSLPFQTQSAFFGKAPSKKTPNSPNTAYSSVQPHVSPHHLRFAQHATISAIATAGLGKRNATSHQRQPNNPANQCRPQRAQRHAPPTSGTTRAQRNPVGGRCCRQ
jgi:hypothetical protein